MVAVACLVVFLAMSIDLIFGWRKAKIRGEAHSSYALSRSITKFLMYEGSCVLASGIDVLLYLAQMWDIFGISQLDKIPVATFVVAIFLCFVELLSMREKADEKTRKHFKDAASVAGKVLDREALIEMLTESFRNAQRKEDD